MRSMRQMLVMVCGVLLCAPVLLEAFPTTIDRWQRRDSVMLAPAAGLPLFGGSVLELEAFRCEQVLAATYTLGREEVRVVIARCATPVDAFGMLGARAGVQPVTGVPGDAQRIDRDTRAVVYGPFYMELTRRGARRVAPPDESFADALMRWLFTQADCHPVDIPLPDDERVIGSERVVDGAALWRGERKRLGDGLVRVLGERRAWTAVYRKRMLPIERVLYQVSGDTASIAALHRALGAELQRTMRLTTNSCGVLGASSATAQYLVLRNGRTLWFVRTDRSDDGACWWIRDIFPSAR